MAEPGSPAEYIRLERRDAIATITIDRPEARNALTRAMKQHLIRLCSDLARDADVRVVLLRATGRAFASGADIKEMAALSRVDDFTAMSDEVEQLYCAIEAIPATTVAVVEGPAIGSGMFLALSCDLRIATPAVRLGATFVRGPGNCLVPTEYQRLIAALGTVRTRELLLWPRVLTGAEAATWGLVSEVIEADQLEDRVHALALELASHAPLAVWATKESIRMIGAREPLSDDVLRHVLASDDFREGRNAFREGRPPKLVEQVSPRSGAAKAPVLLRIRPQPSSRGA